MEKEELYEKIEDYLRNRLPAEERTAFEEAVAADPELAEAVAIHRDMLGALGDADALDFRRQLREIAAREFPATGDGSGPRRHRWGWGLGGLSLLILLGLLVWRLWLPDSPAGSPVQEDRRQAAPPQEQQATPGQGSQAPAEEDEPAATPGGGQPQAQRQEPAQGRAPEYLALAESLYDAPIDEFSGLRGQEDTELLKDTVRLATQEFLNKNYRLSLRLAGEVSGANPSYWMARRIAAHSAFLLRNYARASTLFSEIATAAPPSFAEEAEGNLLLAFLAAGQEDYPDFLKLLDKLATDEGHPYHDRALAVQRALK